MIRAIVLAAGESRRMGSPKLLLPFGKRTIIHTIVENALRSRVDEVIVVLGANKQKIRAEIRDLSVRIVENVRHADGMLSSVRKGFRALPDDTRAAIFLLGDQPSIPSAAIDRVIEGYERSKSGIVLPVHRGRRGHPVLIDVKYRDEVDELDPEIGLRGLIHNHPEDLLQVEVESPEVLRDIDSPEDYERETGQQP